MPNMTIEKRAMQFVKRILKKEKWQVNDVARGNRHHNGYDLIAKRGRLTRKIEVKGCSKMWAIPDFFNTEWNELKQRIVADYLYVVFFPAGKRILHCEIPRKEIGSKDVNPRTIYQFKSAFKKQSRLEPYLKKN